MSELNLDGMTDEQLDAFEAALIARRAEKAKAAEEARLEGIRTAVNGWVDGLTDALAEVTTANESGDVDATAKAIFAFGTTVAEAVREVRNVTKVTGKVTGGAPAARNGELRDMVRDFLTENRGEHGPSAIATALGRSSGAVGNACERLVELGEADMTKAAPKRYSRDAYVTEGDSDPK